MNVAIFDGWIPVNVSVNDLAIVIAGFAKDVEEVKKYADPIYNPIRTPTVKSSLLVESKIINTRKKVAMSSDIKIL